MTRYTLRAVILCVAMSFSARLTAQTGGSVVGRVLNAATNSPIPHALVTLRGADAGPVQTYVTQTGSDGRFSISDIVPGNYVPIASKSGFDQGHSQRMPTPSDTPPIAIQTGQALPIDIRLTPQASITGRIIDGDGDPVRRANVQAQQYFYVGGKKDLRTTANAATDDRGQYRLYNLTAGKYWLLVAPNNRFLAMGLPMHGSGQGQPQANAEPLSGLAATYYPGSPDFGHATELVVTPGAALENIDMRLAPERLYAIRGSLPQGEARQGLSIYATSLDPNTERGGFQTRFYEDHFELIGLGPGKYMVNEQQVSTPQRKITEQRYARQVVEIVDRDVEHVDLTLSPGATIHGVIKASDESLLKNNLNVSFQETDAGRANGYGARVAAGAFSITILPGTYTVHVNGGQAYLQYILAGSDRLPDFKIDTARLPGNLTLVIANDFGKVEGTVTDDAGKPVYNANVTLIPDAKTADAQDRFRSAYTLANGEFSMTTVPPGQYRLFAWAGVDPGAPLDPDFLKPFQERGVAVKVESNSKQSFDLKVILAPHTR